MRCLVRGCDASEERVEQGVEVAFVIDGEEGEGWVCEDHVTLVVAGDYTAFSLGPLRLPRLPRERG